MSGRLIMSGPRLASYIMLLNLWKRSDLPQIQISSFRQESSEQVNIGLYIACVCTLNTVQSAAVSPTWTWHVQPDWLLGYVNLIKIISVLIICQGWCLDSNDLVFCFVL